MNPTQRRVHVVLWVLVLAVTLTAIVIGALLRKGPRPAGPSVAHRAAEPAP
jgi:hypothetical protein